MFGKKKKSPPKQRQPEYSPPKTNLGGLRENLRKTSVTVKKPEETTIDMSGHKIKKKDVDAFRGTGNGNVRKKSSGKKFPDNLIPGGSLSSEALVRVVKPVVDSEDLVLLKKGSNVLDSRYDYLNIDLKGVPVPITLGDEQDFLVKYEGELYFDRDLIYNRLAEKYPGKRKSSSSNRREKKPPPLKLNPKTKKKNPSSERKSNSPKGPTRTRSNSRGKGKAPATQIIPKKNCSPSSTWDGDLLDFEFKYNRVSVLKGEVYNQTYESILKMLDSIEIEPDLEYIKAPVIKELKDFIKSKIKDCGKDFVPLVIKPNNAGEGTSRRMSTGESLPELPTSKPELPTSKPELPKQRTGRRRRSKSGTPKKERRRSGSGSPKTERRRRSKSGSPKTGRKEGGAPPKAPLPPKKDKKDKKEKEDKKGERKTGCRKSKS